MAATIVIRDVEGIDETRAVEALQNEVWGMGPGIEKWVAVLRFVTLVVLIVGAVVALWNAAVVLGSGQRRWPAKVWSIVLAVSCVITLWVGLVFKLAGFGGNF